MRTEDLIHLPVRGWLPWVTGLMAWIALVSGANAQSSVTWRLTRELTVAEATSNGRFQFTRIKTLLPTAAGGVLVADAGSQEIHVLKTDGTYSHQIGKIGRGPGEYVRLRSVGLMSDTVWVIDGDERRISLFSMSGKLIRMISVEYTGNTSSWVPNLTGIVPGGAIGTAVSSFATGPAFRDLQTPVLSMTRAGGGR